MNRHVTIEMPDHVWGLLATVADNRECAVADVIARAIAVELGSTVRLVGPPTDNLSILTAEVSAARRNGYRVPLRGKRGRKAA